MFKFLKNIVGKKIQKKEEIPFSVIEMWLDKKVKESEIDEEIKTVLDDISAQIKIMIGALKELFYEKSEEDNKEELQELKEEFIGKIKKILPKINVPQQITMEVIVEYDESLASALKEIFLLDEEYGVVQQNFSNQTEIFDNSLSELSELQKRLSEIVQRDNGALVILNAKRKIKEIQKKQKKIQELKIQIDREELRKKQTEQHKLKLETEIDNLKNTDEFEEYDSLISKKVKLENELEKETDSFKRAFAPVSKIFIHYEKHNLGAEGYLARKYADDPVKAVKEDNNLIVLKIVENILSNLNLIEPDEKKRDKMRAQLNSINRQFIEGHLERMKLIRSSEADLKKQITLNNTTTKIEDIKYSLQHVNQQLGVLDNNKEECEKIINALNVEKDISELEQQLKTLGSIKIT